MLLHINGKFTMETLKSSLNQLLSISRCRSRYEADIYVSVVVPINITLMLAANKEATEPRVVLS
jgi:hypothetical protein